MPSEGRAFVSVSGHFPVHGEVTAPGVFDLVQGGVGLGEQFGVGLAVTREQADADACRDDIILPEGDMGELDGEPPAFGFEGFEPIGKGNVLGEHDEFVPARCARRCPWRGTSRAG